MQNPAGNETNWAGSHRYRAGILHRPAGIEELREIVAAAPQVRVLGSRHAFNDITDAAELVSLDGLPPDVHVDRAAGTVTFGAALRYGELAAALAEAGLALHNLASLPHIAVGGAVANATHGSGDRNGNLATAVAALELVTSDGALVGGAGRDPRLSRRGRGPRRPRLRGRVRRCGRGGGVAADRLGRRAGVGGPPASLRGPAVGRPRA